MFYPELLPPLSVTLEEAHREIRYLQQKLYFANEQLAIQVVEREKDRRAARGNIEALKKLNQQLKRAHGQHY
jgi:hypothetical protein